MAKKKAAKKRTVKRKKVSKKGISLPRGLRLAHGYELVKKSKATKRKKK